jgi:hypothetical protein
MNVLLLLVVLAVQPPGARYPDRFDRRFDNRTETRYPSSDNVSVFYLKPNAGWTPTTWGGGITEPTWQWYGSDPDGSGGQSWAGTVTGTIEDVTSPVCANGSCWTAKKFDGTNDYIDADSEWGDPEDQDFAVCVVFHRPPPATAATVLASKRSTPSSDGWILYVWASAECVFIVDSGATSISENASVSQNARNMCCGFRDYDGNVGVYAQGAIATPTANTTTSIDVAEVVSVGSQYTTHANKMLGLIDWLGIWKGTGTAPVTEAEFDALNARIFGLHPSTGPSDVAFTRTTVGCGEDAAGNRQCFGSGVPVLANGDAISVWGAVTNYSLNSLDWSAHTVIGDSVVTVNTTSGPSAVYNGGAEADTLTDDNDTDGAGADDGDADYEGVRIVAETTYTGAYTVDAYVKPGTNTGATIDIVTDGTGSKTCTYTGLDNLATATSVGGSIQCIGGAACTGSNSYPTGFARLVCTTTLGGVPSATTADLYVGDAAADTGTIIASAGEAWRLAYPGRACPTAATTATCNADNLSVATTGWPTSEGRVVLSYTPEVEDGYTSNCDLLDALDATAGFHLRRLATSGVLNWYSKSSTGVQTTKSSAALTWTRGTTYEIDVRWWANGVVKAWRDDVLVIDATGADVADAVQTPATIGADGGTGRAYGRLKLIEVSK